MWGRDGKFRLSGSKSPETVKKTGSPSNVRLNLLIFISNKHNEHYI